MKLQEIKQQAEQRGLKTGKLKKTELVRAIQLDEGNEPCFDTGNAADCGQSACLWREDCA